MTSKTLVDNQRAVNNQQALINAYQQLDSVMKQIMQVAAVTDPMARTRLLSSAAEMGVTHANGRAPSYKEDRDALNAIIDQGLMQFVGKSGSGSIQVAGLLDDYVFRDAFRNGIAKAVADKNWFRPYALASWEFSNDPEIARRSMQLAFYSGDWQTWVRLVRRHRFRPHVLDPFCLETFKQLAPGFKADLLSNAAARLINYADGRQTALATHAAEILGSMEQLSESVIVAAIDLFSAQGDVASLQMLAHRIDGPRSEIQGCSEFLQGHYDTARKHFDAAVTEARKRTRKRRLELPHISSIFYGLLLLKENTAQSQGQLNQGRQGDPRLE